MENKSENSQQTQDQAGSLRGEATQQGATSNPPEMAAPTTSGSVPSAPDTTNNPSLSPRPKKGKGVLVAGLVVLALLIAGGTYVYANRSTTDKPEETPQAISVDDKVFAGVSDDLARRHLVNQAKTPKQRFVTKISGDAQTSTTTEVDLSTQRISFAFTNPGGNSATFIYTSGKSYVKSSNNPTWWEQSTDQNNTTDQNIITPDAYKEELQKGASSTYKKLGKEACGDLTCYKYEVTDPQKTITSLIWFDTKDLLLRKSETKLAGVNTAISYSYDNISIVPPQNAKKLPEGKSLSDYLFQ